MCFLRILHINPQENLKVLVMAELATKKAGAESGLVPRLAGGWLHPCSSRWIYKFFARLLCQKLKAANLASIASLLLFVSVLTVSLTCTEELMESFILAWTH